MWQGIDALQWEMIDVAVLSDGRCGVEWVELESGCLGIGCWMLIAAATIQNSGAKCWGFFMGSLLCNSVRHCKSNADHSHTRHIIPRTSLCCRLLLLLRQHHLIAVSPEGTSYSLPSIARVLPGAAWVTGEYFRNARKQKLVAINTKKGKLIYLSDMEKGEEEVKVQFCGVGYIWDGLGILATFATG